MAHGGAGGGGTGVAARAIVQIGVDRAEFDAAISSLPKATKDQFDKVTAAIAAAMAKNNAAIKAAQARQQSAFGANGGGIAQYNAARIEIEKLSRANVLLESNARRAAQSMVNMGRSAHLAAVQAANAARQQAAATQAAYQQTVNASAATQARAARMNAATQGGGGGGRGSRGGRGGGSSAMTLMLLGQTIDDIQYGFRSIVNNIPTLTASMLQMFGVSSTKALALGGAVGIVAVAINQLIDPVTNLLTHLDELGSVVAKDSFLGKMIESLKSVRDYLASNTELLKNFGKEVVKSMGYDVDAGDAKSRIKGAEGIKSQYDIDRDKATAGLAKGGAAAIAQVGGGKRALDILMQPFADTKDTPAMSPEHVALKGAREAMEEQQRVVDSIRKNSGSGMIAGSTAADLAREQGKLPQLQKDLDYYKAKADEVTAKAGKAPGNTMDPATREALRAERADLLTKIANPGKEGADPKDVDKFLKMIKGTSLEGLTTSLAPDTLKASKEEAERLNKEREDGQKDELAANKKRNDEAEKFSDDAAESIGPRIMRSMLANPDSKKSRTAEQVDVARSLKRSGLDSEGVQAVLPEVMRKIAEKLDEAITARILRENSTPEKARADELSDLDEQAKENARAQVEDAKARAREKLTGGLDQQRQSQTFSSGSELARSLIDAGLNGKDEQATQEEILVATQANTVQLGEINKGVNNLANDLKNPKLAARFQ